MRFRLFVFVFLPLAIVVSIIAVQRVHSAPPAKGTFRAEQKKNARVRTAYQLKWPGIKTQLNKLGVDTSSFQLLIRIFKEEKQVEAWVKSAKNPKFQLFTTYAICESSGTLGPKRCQGDLQVPEGFYNIYTFNPYSNYHLSLGVSYPNASDKVFACKRDAGGAIMIHGDCVTIGCVPITDEKIRELYVLAVEARNGGQQNIQIHAYPAKLTTTKLTALKKLYTDKSTQALWDNLKQGYDKFEATNLPPDFMIDKQGKYVFK
jgi:murein L,D-transpeptidase YafK